MVIIHLSEVLIFSYPNAQTLKIHNSKGLSEIKIFVVEAALKTFFFSISITRACCFRF